MTAVAALGSSTLSSLREDLTDAVYIISPTETPFQANIAKESCKQPTHQWQIDELASASTTNYIADGADAPGIGDTASGVFDNNADTGTKLTARCQISVKYLITTRRANKSVTAGYDREMNFQVAKHLSELKRDVEATLTQPRDPVAGTVSAAGQTAGLPSWLTTNTARDAGGSDPGLTSGEPSSAAAGDIDGTDRALSEATLLDVIGQCYTSGGNPDMIMMGREAKQRFSQFMMSGNSRIATPFQDHTNSPSGGAKVVGAVDFYVSDFGTLAVVPNRFQREDDVFVLDTDYWAVGYLDGYRTEDLSKQGDAERKQILVDYCLVSRNEAASGVVADIDETTAMTV